MPFADTDRKLEKLPDEQQNPFLSSPALKLFCDFRKKKLYGAGRELPFEILKTQGAVHFDPVKGMGVFKGGINEVEDPGFEGQGWTLGDGASVDTSRAFTGSGSLRIEGSGDTSLKAALKEKIVIAGGDCRTISFYKSCSHHDSGKLEVRATAFGMDGQLLGSEAAFISCRNEGWQPDGFIWNLARGAAAYTLEILSQSFAGVCHLDAFLAEPKSFFTPYFDGNSPSCLWVLAATPQHLCATPVAGGPVGRLFKQKSYFYRVSSVDRHGRESPASYEVKARTGWRHRKILLTWDRDPQAVKYRIYRGLSSRSRSDRVEVEDNAVSWSWDRSQGIKRAIYDLPGNTAGFTDSGFNGAPGEPLAAGGDSGSASGARSLRPDSDARISGREINCDLKTDFWVAGEVEFGFANDRPFQPASFFEIGSPLTESALAVSMRFFPKWGDQDPQILLIKMADRKERYAKERLQNFGVGSVIRFVAAQIYARTDLPAGAHLWYKIDTGQVHHLTVPDVRLIEGAPLLTISKRFYYDWFGNNSFCRAFAVVQGSTGEKAVHELLQTAAEMGMAVTAGSDLR